MVRHTPLWLNVVTNYFGQFYVAVIGIVMIPIYIHYIGIEAYGVIGFLVTLQAWMSVLDFGLAPTLGREAARYKAGLIQASALHRLIALTERFFFAIAVVMLIVSSLSGNWIALNWLKLANLDVVQVALCIPLTGLMISTRLGAGAYRSALQGMENQIKANVLAVIFTTIRSVFVVAVLVWISSTILTFITFQLVISALELIYLRRALFTSLPTKEIDPTYKDKVSLPFRFLRGMAFLYWMGVAFSQVDKLLLSHILGMKEYAHFILAATIAMGLNMIATPLQQAVLPRITMLAELGEKEQLISLYRQTTRIMLVMLSGIAGILIAFPNDVLFVWTGDKSLAMQSANVLRWYAAGTVLMSLAGMPYLLQQAYGKLDLHIKGSVISLIIFIPTVIFATSKYGGVGAAITWLCLNFFGLLIFSPIVHHRFAKGIALKWLARDILPTLILVTTFSLFASTFNLNIESRLYSGIFLFLLCLMISSIILCSFKDVRENFIRMVNNFFKFGDRERNN